MFNNLPIPSEEREFPSEQSFFPMAGQDCLTANPLVLTHAVQAPSQSHLHYTDHTYESFVQSILDQVSIVDNPSRKFKLNITEVKILLASFNEVLTNLEGIINYLQVTRKSLTDDEWNSKVIQAEQKREDLTNLYNSLADPMFVRELVGTIKTQKKKRQWRKKKKMLWQEKKKHYKLLTEREHKRIDLWLEKMKDEVERARRAETIKKDCDLILADVTQKKSSAKRYLNLLNTLVKLRTARVQQAIASGKPVSVDENETFVKVIEKLKGLWMDQMKEYNLEETGLRVFLDDAQTERINVEDKLQNQTFQKWQEFFFGRDKSKKPPGEPDTVMKFTVARSAWDRFVAEPDDVGASAIPIGWVIPGVPNDAHWARFIVDR